MSIVVRRSSGEYQCGRLVFNGFFKTFEESLRARTELLKQEEQERRGRSDIGTRHFSMLTVLLLKLCRSSCTAQTVSRNVIVFFTQLYITYTFNLSAFAYTAFAF